MKQDRTAVAPRYIRGVRAAAAYLSLHPNYVTRLVKEGRVRASRLGTHCLLFDPRDLDAFVESHQVAGGLRSE